MYNTGVGLLSVINVNWSHVGCLYNTGGLLVNQAEYISIENHMLHQMQDSAHDKYHVYRVLNFALDIASCNTGVNIDVLIAACMLHDIGREMQFSNTKVCHAQAGGDMAYDFLLSIGWGEENALHVKECICAHRFRQNNAPQSVEAQILYDSDKLEACGVMGIARTLIYAGQVAEPLYILDKDGQVIVDSKSEATNSFVEEYNYKLKNVYCSLYTDRAKEIALSRQTAAINFYNELLNEISENIKNGIDKYKELLWE